MDEIFDKAIREAKCKHGINFISIDESNNAKTILEVYYKNENEYKIVGVTHTSGNYNFKPYEQVVYDELKSQGLSEAGCLSITMEILNEEASKKMMNYLKSVRNKSFSYTELWEEKNKIIKYDKI